VTEEDEVTDTFIRTVAAEVKGHGPKYEETLKEMEKENPKYAFLTDRSVSASTPFLRIIA
jgi:U2-associated protein SR140